MALENNYIVNVRVRNLSFHPDGYKKEAVELHRHHFDSFQDAFACLLSFDEKDFFEKNAVKNRHSICLESIDLDMHALTDVDKPTIITAMRGGDSPLIDEPPGLYYILWNGTGNFCNEYNIALNEFAGYNASRMLLPIAKFNIKQVDVTTDPAFQRLKHPYLQQYLAQNKYCLSTFSIASNFEASSVENFSGLMIDAWHFNSLRAAMQRLAELNLQMFDLGYTGLQGSDFYYRGIKLYEERGDTILSISTNIYERKNTPPKGIYLDWNQDSPVAECVRNQWLPHEAESSILIAKYSSEFLFEGPSDEWKRLKSVDFTLQKSDIIKKHARVASTVKTQLNRQQNKLH